MKKEYEILKILQGYIYYADRKDRNGLEIVGHVEYADFVKEAVALILTKEFKHNEKYELKAKYPEDYTLEDVQEYFYKITRMENIEIGTIAKELENHNFVNIYNRYLKILKENKKKERVKC